MGVNIVAKSVAYVVFVVKLPPFLPKNFRLLQRLHVIKLK